MQKTLAEIAQFVGGDVVGDAKIMITGLSGIKEAKSGDLTFLANPKYSALAQVTKASAIIAPRQVAVPGRALIYTDNPSLAFAKIASLFLDVEKKRAKGIHRTAVIDETVKLGKDVTIGPYTVVEAGAKIGDNTVIYSQCFVGQETIIGKNCLIYSNVSIRERISIGNRAIIHSGTVIGSDGFGFVAVDGVHTKIPQIGTVVIEDDVEIGANVTIDRARFDVTLIGQGTKIDNLVQIAHNVRIGKNCIIVSQVGISGSSVLEDNVTLAGQVGVAGHLTIGANTVVASKSGIPSSVPANSILWGIPAKPHMQAKRVNACVQRLPEYIKIINEMKIKIAELEAKLK